MGIKDEVKDTLKTPAGSAMALGPLSFLGGMALILVIPIIALIFGFGIYIVLQALPYIVAGFVMILMFWILGIVGAEEKHRYIGSILFGTVALLPLYVDKISSALASQMTPQVSQAVGAQSVNTFNFLNHWLSSLGNLSVAVSAVIVLIFLAIGLLGITRNGSIGALAGGTIALVVALVVGTSVVGLGTEVHPSLSISEVDAPSEGSVQAKTDTYWKIEMNGVWTTGSMWKGILGDAHRVKINTDKDEQTNQTVYKMWVDYSFDFTIKEVNGQLRDEDFGSSMTTVFVDIPPSWNITSASAKTESGNLNYSASHSGNKIIISNGGEAEEGSHVADVDFTVYRESTEPIEKPGPQEKALGWPIAVAVIGIIAIIGSAAVYFLQKRNVI